MLGEVTEVFLVDGNPTDIYKIKVSIKRSFANASNEFAYPLNPYIKSIPIIGEQVYLINGMGATSGPLSGGYDYYYISPTFLQRSINNNPLPKAIIQSAQTFNSTTYTGQVIPNVSSPDSGDVNFGKGFSEINNLSQLQPYIGDTIFEGRFGQSIRFGYTPSQTDAKKLPTWNSSNAGKPITIIRNTQNSTNTKGYDKFVLEDVNKDDSSIWLTSNQKVGITPSNKTAVSNISQFSKPQVIINSDRLIFNSKTDSIVISSKKDIAVSTSQYTTTINLIISAIETLAQGTFPVAGAATGPHPQLATILSKLKSGIG